MPYRLASHRYSEIEELTTNDLLNYSSLVLPISIDEIIENMGIKIKSYADLSPEKLALLVNLGASSDNGFSINNGKKEWRIFYDKTGYECRDNSTKAHELGHRRLDHSERSDLAEAEANVYMSRILAPYPILCAMNVQKVQDSLIYVIDTFNLSATMAANTLSRFFNRRQFNSGLTPYEQTLYDKFIDKKKKGGFR